MLTSIAIIEEMIKVLSKFIFLNRKLEIGTIKNTATDKWIADATKSIRNPHITLLSLKSWISPKQAILVARTCLDAFIEAVK